MIVEELSATSPALARTDPDYEAAACVGTCKCKHARPTPEDRITGTNVEWARLVAADPGKTCDHWISWGCLKMALERDDDDDVDIGIRLKIFNCPECNEVIDAYWRIAAPGHKM